MSSSSSAPSRVLTSPPEPFGTARLIAPARTCSSGCWRSTFVGISSALGRRSRTAITTLLESLGTIVRNTGQQRESGATFTLDTIPTPHQQHALDLVETINP